MYVSLETFKIIEEFLFFMSKYTGNADIDINCNDQREFLSFQGEIQFRNDRSYIVFGRKQEYFVGIGLRFDDGSMRQMMLLKDERLLTMGFTKGKHDDYVGKWSLVQLSRNASANRHQTILILENALSMDDQLFQHMRHISRETYDELLTDKLNTAIMGQKGQEAFMDYGINLG